MMYVNAFWFGVFVTISAECICLVIGSLISSKTKAKLIKDRKDTK